MPTKKKTTGKKAVNEHPLFDFNIAKVTSYADNIETNRAKLSYLNYVKKEYELYRKNLKVDPELYSDGIPFSENIDIHIRYAQSNQEEELQRIKGKITWLKKREDFAALFDALMGMGFIPNPREKNKYLCDHFSWGDEEMTPDQLKQVRSDYKKRPELYKLSEEMERMLKYLKGD